MGNRAPWGGCVTKEPSPPVAEGHSREEWIHVRLFLCIHWRKKKKKPCIGKWTPRIGGHISQKIWGRPAPSCLSIALPTASHVQVEFSAWGRGKDTQRLQYLPECIWQIHLVFCIFQVNDLTFFSSLLPFPPLLRFIPCRWGIVVSCRSLRMEFPKF